MAELEETDYSKYEPLRLDDCTVVTNIKKFLDSHRTVVKSYGEKRIAEPYLKRGKLAVQKMKEIDESLEVKKQ